MQWLQQSWILFQSLSTLRLESTSSLLPYASRRKKKLGDDFLRSLHQSNLGSTYSKLNLVQYTDVIKIELEFLDELEEIVISDYNQSREKINTLVCIKFVDDAYRELGQYETCNSKQVELLNKLPSEGRQIYLATTHVDGTDGLSNPICQHIMSYL